MSVAALCLAAICHAPARQELFVTERVFSWSNPRRRANGDPLSLWEILETRLYCNDKQIASAPGPAAAVAVFLSAGVYRCYVTSVDLAGLESKPSTSIDLVVVADRFNIK